MPHSQKIASRTLGLGPSPEKSNAIMMMMELITISTSTVGKVEIVKG